MEESLWERVKRTSIWENASEVGKVFQLAWRHDDPMVRCAALNALMKGFVQVDRRDREAIAALKECGCVESPEGSGIEPREGCVIIGCPGATRCYDNYDLYDLNL